jgi:ATP/ADP translocase
VIYKEDRKLVFFLGVFLVLISATNTLFQIAGDALFISNIGVANLPLMYIISAVVLAIMAIGVIPVIDRMGRIRIYNITAGLLASELLLCWWFSTLNIRWIYYPVYVTTYILETFLFLEFWLIAGDICHTRQAKRIFPVLLGGSLVAGAVTAFLVKISSPVIETGDMLLVTSLFCWFTIPASRCLSKFLRKMGTVPSGTIPNFSKDISVLERLSLDLKIIWQSKLVRLLSFSFILYTLLSFFLDFEFNRAASLHFTAGGKVITEKLAGFYGLVKGWGVLCAIFLQFAFSAIRL